MVKIAIACSGLGHIHRGIETWAADLAGALREAGEDVTLFQGSGEPAEDWQKVLPCQKRFDPKTQAWVRRLKPLGGWRYGFGSGYEMEQTTFALKLWPKIRADYDILHVQDPTIAQIMEQLNRKHLSRPRVILAHGTEEPTETLQKFSHLQHLAPCYLTDWEAHRPPKQQVFAIPNFVDAAKFSPGNKCAARKQWNLPPNDFIVLCVAAIKKTHKRMDDLLREFALFSESYAAAATLVIAGGREVESDEIIAEGRRLLGSRVQFLEGVSREKIPDLYRAADVFALASRHEMMPIALLEALASGLPVVCNDTPTLRWMVGPAGELNDISQAGNLALQLENLANPIKRAALSMEARNYAEANFSTGAVVEQIRAMHTKVAGSHS